MRLIKVEKLKRFKEVSSDLKTRVAKCRGSWAYGSWVWVNVMGEKKFPKTKNLKFKWQKVVRKSPRTYQKSYSPSPK